MSSEDLEGDNIADISTTLLTLRKPTDLHRVIDSIPKPAKAVPKNGLPIWYKMGLENKLPVPKMPQGRIVFSRGKVGEDVRRLEIGGQPSFDLTDPYCYNVSYDYVPVHDPHLAHHFAQKETRNRMKKLGYVTKDGRAVCSLKEFNQYRKYLYNRFMDRIHSEMKKLDEKARDDLVLYRVDRDVARKLLIFNKEERAREHLEKVARDNADEWAEKKRLAKEQEKKIQARMRYLAEYNEKTRKERAARAFEKESRIKQRVQAAAEMELRRKIIMIRTWRINEKKRVNRLKKEKEEKERRLEEQANTKWATRINSQNQKIQEKDILLKIYSEDMAAGAARRHKISDMVAYRRDLELARIRLANLHALHGGTAKAAQLVRKMGAEFEKTKRGAKGMTPEVAYNLAVGAMSNAVSTVGDRLMTLGQARARMDVQTVLPTPPIFILDELMEAAILEFARRRVTLLLRNVEHVTKSRAAIVFFQNFRPYGKKKKSKQPRWSAQVGAELARHAVRGSGDSVAFGDIVDIPSEATHDIDMKSVKNRPPTPVPSMTKLAEVTFSDRLDDLPDPIALGSNLPERKKIVEMVHAAARLLARSVSARVLKCMDIITGKVTMPHMRRPMEWGEAVEGMSDAVVNNRIHVDSADVRRTSEFLTRRILRQLQADMKEEKRRLKFKGFIKEEPGDFYDPDKVKES